MASQRYITCISRAFPCFLCFKATCVFLLIWDGNGFHKSPVEESFHLFSFYTPPSTSCTNASIVFSYSHRYKRHRRIERKNSFVSREQSRFANSYVISLFFVNCSSFLFLHLPFCLWHAHRLNATSYDLLILFVTPKPWNIFLTERREQGDNYFLKYVKLRIVTKQLVPRQLVLAPLMHAALHSIVYFNCPFQTIFANFTTAGVTRAKSGTLNKQSCCAEWNCGDRRYKYGIAVMWWSIDPI